MDGVAETDWKALYLDAVAALMAMECRAETAEAARSEERLSHVNLWRWKVDPHAMAIAKKMVQDRLQQRAVKANGE